MTIYRASATFHAHSYTPLGELPEVLKRLLTHFPRADENSLVHDAYRLSEETISLLENLPNVGDPLPTTWLNIELEKRSPVNVPYRLLVNPLLLRPELAVLPNEDEPELAKWTRTPFIGKSGFTTAQVGEQEVARSGFATLAIEGYWHYQRSSDIARLKEEGTPEGVKVIEQVRRDITAFLEVISPYYAFVSNCSDYPLWHTGPLTHFPPPTPWRYLWSFMSYGPELSAEIGRSKLLSTPAVRLEEHGNRIDIQPLTWLTRPVERPKMREHERAHAVCDHLGLQLSFEAIANS